MAFPDATNYALSRGAGANRRRRSPNWSPFRVTSDKTHVEHNESALALIADMPADMDFRCNGHISGQIAEIAAIRSPRNNCIENGTSILSAFAEEFAAMDVTRQGLVEHFQLLSDDELLADFRHGDLTELAKGVAAEELARRKIDP